MNTQEAIEAFRLYYPEIPVSGETLRKVIEGREIKSETDLDRIRDHIMSQSLYESGYEEEW